MNQWAAENTALISLINTFGMIILTTMYVIFTIKIQRANKEVVVQNDIIRAENNAPIVITYLEMTTFNLPNIKLENISKNAAKNIYMELEPQNEVVNIERLDSSSFIGKRIAFLAPSQSLKTLLGSLLEIKNSKGDYPIFNVKITYYDLNNKEYFQEYTIDTNMFKGNLQVVQKTTHELTKEVEKIERHLSKIVRNNE